MTKFLKPPIFLLLALPLGCNEYKLVENDDLQGVDEDEGVPDIAVDPTSVNFGDVDVEADGSAEASEMVIITNEGEADLHIQGLEIDDVDAPFSVGAVSSVLIQPGATAQFTVTFTPETAEESTAKVLIESDDPDEGVAEVELLGMGVAPVIDVSPSEYDFGTLYIGCEVEQPLVVSNLGNADLVVDAFEYNTGSSDLVFDYDEDVNGELPWTLEASDSVEVYVTYTPYDEYSDIAYLTIESNDPYTPELMVTQEAEGEVYGSALDSFEQPLQGETDIIFAVDRSCSMDDDIEAVQDNFSTFTSTMLALDSDYQIAATVEDDGCINGSDLYINSTFSDSEAESTITTMINLGGSYGSATEKGFMLLEACLANVGTGECNDGLVRDDATLNLIGVSDEPEQSTNNYAYYVALFQSLKGDPDDVIMHAIGGDYPSGCGSASAYTGFYEATVATGGLFLSICATDWGAHLEELAEGSAADRSSFQLSSYPVADTIIVQIDGVTTTVGWEYNDSDNSIDFESDHVPDGGSTIDVEYALYGDCDG